jgi:hypothetical protein
MYAVEFKSKIKNGTISIPEEYKDRFGEQVRVILLADEETTDASFLDQLIENPIRIPGFEPRDRDKLHERD